MFWILSLFLLGIVNAQKSPSTDSDTTLTTISTTTPGTTSTPIPTTTPETTSTPIPTTTPETTSTPIPTTTPETTSTPIPTTTPETTSTPIPTTTPETTSTPISTTTPIQVPITTSLESIDSLHSGKSRKRFVLLQGPDDKLAKILNERLEKILRDYKPNGNEELTIMLDKIQSALNWGNDRLDEKLTAVIEFATYNDRRLLLEKAITDRIEVLNDLLPNVQPYTRCSRFYLKQRSNLKDAGRLSNAEKIVKLKENSDTCPYNIENISDEYDYDYDYYFLIESFENK